MREGGREGGQQIPISLSRLHITVQILQKETNNQGMDVVSLRKDPPC